MRIFHCIIICLLVPAFAFAQSQPRQTKKMAPAKTYIIKGLVTETFNYCGGAKPTDEMLEQLRIPTAAANKTFYIRTGSKNSNGAKLWKVTTDDAGHFTIKLAPGTYCIINGWQVKPPAYGTIQSNTLYEYRGDECLKGAWANCYYRFTVKNKGVTVNFNYHHECFANEDNPCMQYIGPYPP